MFVWPPAALAGVALALWLTQHRHLMAGLFGQQVDQFAARRRMTHDQHWRHAVAQVTPRDKVYEHETLIWFLRH